MPFGAKRERCPGAPGRLDPLDRMHHHTWSMTRKARRHVDDLRGVSRLAIEATQAVTGVVEAMHRTIASGPRLLGRPLERPARILTGIVYGSVRGVTKLVGGGIDAALMELAPWLGESVPGPEREAVLAALNGVLGDYLSETHNPLAIVMLLRKNGHPLQIEQRALSAAIPDATGKLLVLVHGSCMNDLQWGRSGHDHGALLARDLGYSPVYLHYNTGLHISTNGREFAAYLERLVAEWPVPLEELAIVAHSMGGLVARSACHYGEVEGHVWRRRLRKLVCLGSPHHGAPLERGGSWIDLLLGFSPYSAPLARLGQIRSAGVTDMRFGSVLDDDWTGRDRFAGTVDPRRHLALPVGVECYAVAGTSAPKVKAKLPGDGLVPVDSALGRHVRPELVLRFPEAHQWIAFGTGHIHLLHRAEVYEAVRGWLAQ
jgi:pimeloyl-ACP methyl ester carboxylesterase